MSIGINGSQARPLFLLISNEDDELFAGGKSSVFAALLPFALKRKTFTLWAKKDSTSN